MNGRKPMRFRVAFGIAAVGAVLLAQVVQAQVASDQSAGYVVFPKVVVDTAGLLTGGPRVDTLIQLTNTDTTNSANGIHQFHCFWINANSCCGAACSGANSTVCDPNSANPCEGGLPCVQSWSEESNFQVQLTPGQPLAFLASTGQSFLNCGAPPAPSGPGCSAAGVAVGSVSGVSSPFTGELKCVEVAVNGASVGALPIPANDLKGEARIYTVSSGTAANSVDVRQYNGVGFPVPASVSTFANTTTAEQDSLCLGTPTDPGCPSQEYAACPDTLIVNHFFDGATPFDASQTIGTTLTLVPCSEDILTATAAAQTPVNVQIAIYNEFEQRFSSTSNVDCYRSTPLSDLDTRPGPSDNATSIFSVGIEGTLTGQTRVRGVPANSDLHGLIGIAEEIYSTSGGSPTVYSDAYNLDYSSTRMGVGDIVRFQP